MTHDKELEQAGKFGMGDGLKMASLMAMTVAHEYWELGNRDEWGAKFRDFSNFLKLKAEEKFTEGRELNPKNNPTPLPAKTKEE